MTREKVWYWISWLWQTFPHFHSFGKYRTKLTTEETLVFMARAGHGWIEWCSGISGKPPKSSRWLFLRRFAALWSYFLFYLPQMLWVSIRPLPLERSRRIFEIRAWQILEISLFQHQMTGKIPLVNSMPAKSFSNHVLNTKTNWQLIIFSESIQVWQDFLLRC